MKIAQNIFLTIIFLIGFTDYKFESFYKIRRRNSEALTRRNTLRYKIKSGHWMFFEFRSVNNFGNCKYLFIFIYKFLFAIVNHKEIYHEGTIKSIFNDPDLAQQWYFVKSNPYNHHLSHKLNKVWYSKIMGRGLTIGFVYGGIDDYHLDLNDNYDRSLSYNFVNNSTKIYPTTNNNPIRSVGLVSAISNNAKCGVGAAPSSKFANLQIFTDDSTLLQDNIVANAILYKNDDIHIYVFGWTLGHDIEIQQYPGPFTINSLKIGYKSGRRSLGSIFVTGQGDLRIRGNNCAFNGFCQRPEILVFGSITSNGSAPAYSERCSSILAASLSTSENTLSDQIYSTLSKNSCKNSTGGPFVSIAISSGILALLLSHNPFLTVRQIIILICHTSVQYDSTAITNSAGFIYSYSHGFGMLNIEKLILFSKSNLIKNISSEHICSTLNFEGNHLVNKNGLKLFYIYSSGCYNSVFCVTTIEQVFMVFTISSRYRNSISIYLTSPNGTRFSILQPRSFDNSQNGFYNWKIKIMGFFGEKPRGVWKIEVYSISSSSRVFNLQLIFHGRCINPNLNVYFHEKIRYSVCKDTINLSHDLFKRICNLNKFKFDPLTGRDIYSFTGEEYTNINSLI